MPAIAAIDNPAVQGKKSIQLFYNNKEANLALVLKSGDPADDDNERTFSAKDKDREGVIYDSSDIDSIGYLGTQLVVGVTTPKPVKGQDPTHNDISIISPVYEPITTVELKNGSVTVCSNGHQAWVYFIGGTSANDVELREYSLENAEERMHKSLRNIVSGSRITSYVASSKRYVIYQDVEYKLREFSVENETNELIDGTGDADDKTSVAVTYDADSGKAFLYYTANRSRELRRVIKSELGWTGPHTVSNANPVGTATQLAVTTSNKTNHVFYVPVKGTAITHVRDPIV